jgi:predicted NBD/HSP70 family sugar kinase
MTLYASIDIGGTNTRIGLSENLKTFKSIERLETPDTLYDLSSYLEKSLPPETTAICLCIAGPVDHKFNRLINGTNIKALRSGISPEELLPKYKTKIIKLLNDSEAGCLSEAIIGEGKNFEKVAYITLSTGVGGAYIKDKILKLDRYNSEPGRHIIEIGGREGISTKIQGEWEAYSSGWAFSQMYGVSTKDCKDENIWESYAEELSIGLHNISVLWSPEVIVLGGGITNQWKYFLPRTTTLLNTSMKAIRPAPELKISSIGDDNILLGGLLYLKQEAL